MGLDTYTGIRTMAVFGRNLSPIGSRHGNDVYLWNPYPKLMEFSLWKLLGCFRQLIGQSSADMECYILATAEKGLLSDNVIQKHPFYIIFCIFFFLKFFL